MYTESITTQRIITRKLIPADHAIWAGFLADPESSRFLGSTDLAEPAQYAAFWIKKQLGRYEAGQYIIHIDNLASQKLAARNAM